MDRKKFLRNSILGALGLAAGATQINASKKQSTFTKMIDQVGFNHLPNKKDIIHMNTVVHKADTRGYADHGWLQARHSFSFANYYNPDRMNFGVLRVLNDDIIAGGRGFGMHPHDNMEIITIPLDGALEHKDSMGNAGVIHHGDVQVMSAGTGIFHSEFNKNTDAKTRLLQIWMFPNKPNVEPRYDQITLANKDLKNQFYQVLSPYKDDEGVWVHQNAWFHMGSFDAGASTTYKINDKNNGVYAFVIDGDVTIAGQPLNRRDGFGIWNFEEMEVVADSDAKVLLMEIPMEL